MKNFGIIFWIMIVIAGCLSATTAFMLESRLDEMETNIEEINSMLKEMTDSTQWQIENLIEATKLIEHLILWCLKVKRVMKKED